MLTEQSLVQQAEEWKAKGNECFQKGALQDAISAYSQGVVACDRLTPPPSALKATLLSNRAMCSLKGIRFQPCIDDCTSALALDPDVKLRSKLLYRRSKARFLLSNLQSGKNNSLLQDAAKDLLQLLQSDPKNTEANKLLMTIRAQHKSQQTAVTPVSKAVDVIRTRSDDDALHNIKLLLSLLDNDTANASMELARLQAIPLLLSVAQENATTKTAVLAVQCLARAASHPPFCQQHLKDHQKDLCSLITETEASSELIVSVLAVLVRILLHADRDDPQAEITGTTAIDSHSVVQACTAALWGHENDKLVLRAVLDVLSTWTVGTQRETTIRASLAGTPDPTLPTPKTATEIRNMAPLELADYRKRQYEIKTRDLAWAMERSVLFCQQQGLRQLLQAACACEDHVVRREIIVVVGRLLAAIDPEDDNDNEKLKKVVQPFLASPKEKHEGVTIEEVYNDDQEEAKQAALKEEAVVPLETKMEHALITAALLLSKKTVGAWALQFGWEDSADELPDLINSENPRAMCLASEVVSGAATVETSRPTVANLMSGGLMQTLMMSEDRDIRSGAASAVAKLGLSDKSTDEAERVGLLQAACDLLEDKPDESSKDADKIHQFSSFAGSSVERAIEMLTYLVANTEIKEELAAGFEAPGASHSAMERLVEITDLPSAGESLSGFGLATIFQHMAVTNHELRKESFEGKEVTMEAYDEMQKMGKTEEEKELLEAQKDTDTPEACNERIRLMAAANVPRALVNLTEGASEHTLEQVVLAMTRMANEPSARGIMIQQGVLSACIKIEKKEGPTETDTMKKVIRHSRHCIAKLLVTTNPTLLTSAQRLGSIRPLIQLIRDIKAKDLQVFEALLAVTNIASSGEDAQNRIVSEKGIGSLHFAMFSDHEMVRRAATEAMCNLVPHKAMMDHLCEADHLKLWLAFASEYEEDYECARAAAGCLAMATQDEAVAVELVVLEKFREHMTSLLECGRLEIMYRAMAIVLNLVVHGGETKKKAVSEGLVEFCRAYADSYHDNKSAHDLGFSKEEKALLPVTVDLAKKIVSTSD